MLKTTGALMLAAVALAATAGGSQSATPAPTMTINQIMTRVMAVQAQAVWDISSQAFNDRGDGLVASKISKKDWERIAEAGRQFKAHGTDMAKAKRLVVAGPDDHVMGEEAAHGGAKRTWDAASRTQIQGLIDGNPALFSKRAMVLAKAGDSLLRAAPKRDVRTLYKVSSNLDEVCDGCHQKFWGTDEPPPAPKGLPTLQARR